jgi:cobalamin biosynthesis Mg chelatase CobN
MQLNEEEKQALREKYKQQRRAMWAGKRASDASGKSAPAEVAHPEAETDIADRHETGDQKRQTHTVSSALTTEPESSTSVTAHKGATVEIADDAFHPDESTSQPTSQQPTIDDADSRQLHQTEQIAAAVNAPRSDTTRLVEKIREQREEMWEAQSSIRSRPEKRRRNSEKAERKSSRGSKEEGEPAMLTWKLALGVIGTIIVLIAIGIGLGIWFASQ